MTRIVYFAPTGLREMFDGTYPAVDDLGLAIKQIVEDDTDFTLVEVNDDSFDQMVFICNNLNIDYKVIVGIPELATPLKFHSEPKDHVYSLHHFVSEVVTDGPVPEKVREFFERAGINAKDVNESSVKSKDPEIDLDIDEGDEGEPQ